MTIDTTILKERFGISYLRPYQELIIRYILDSEDGDGKGRILAVLPTGGGKSLCFMHPIAQVRKRAILIYPLLSLMNDQATRFEKAGLSHVILRGGLDKAERTERMRMIRNDTSMSVITNVETLLAMQERGELAIFAGHTELVVIDEAHTAVTWGETFREAYTRLPELLDEIRPRMTLAFTATVDDRILAGIIRYIFSGERPYVVHASADRENIFYHSVRSLSKTEDIRMLLSPASSRPAIIFCRSRKLTEWIASELYGFDARPYHAGMDKAEKEEKERWFLTSEDGVLVATSAYGMGVDKKDIRTVIHHSLPEDAASFMQESGRGGRDGQRMDSYVLYYPPEQSSIEGVFKVGGCIRSNLLTLMGEERNESNCLACSACVPDGYTAAGEREIMRFISHHPLIKEESAVASLTARHPFFRSQRLPHWREDEVRKAIGILTYEGRLIDIKGRLIARKGK